MNPCFCELIVIISFRRQLLVYLVIFSFSLMDDADISSTHNILSLLVSVFDCFHLRLLLRFRMLKPIPLPMA